jgi:hypothetical protein
MPRIDFSMDLCFRSDASGEHSAALFYGPLMGWWGWDEETSKNGKNGLRIRLQELPPAVEFVREFVAPDPAVGDHGWFAGMTLEHITDNEGNAYVLNKGRSRDAAVNQMTGEWTAHLRAGNARCIAAFGPREGNVPSDDGSNAKDRIQAHAVACKYIPAPPHGSAQGAPGQPASQPGAPRSQRKTLTASIETHHAAHCT